MREKIIQIIIFEKALGIKVVCSRRMRTQDVNTQEAEHGLQRWKIQKLPIAFALVENIGLEKVCSRS